MVVVMPVMVVMPTMGTRGNRRRQNPERQGSGQNGFKSGHDRSPLIEPKGSARL
jgi:hypothetical protein